MVLSIETLGQWPGICSVFSNVVAFVLAAAFAGSLTDHADNIGETVHQRNIFDLIIQCLQ